MGAVATILRLHGKPEWGFNVAGTTYRVGRRKLYIDGSGGAWVSRLPEELPQPPLVRVWRLVALWDGFPYYNRSGGQWVRAGICGGKRRQV